ncbi:MAG: phosphate--AMP phosphotransferase [Candidatus Thermoplasmatota archaeon]|jgi:polyphosphate:AMP phosphotransferase|nr:phosphate--AMP phosphotransferase [Candidatus Thermoplasmatota archaeon]
MLEKLDLGSDTKQSEYKGEMEALQLVVGVLHRDVKELRIPVIIVFEGWDAAGKSTTINSLLLSMDPRNYNVYPIGPPTDDENARPFLWRFWLRTPERGRFAIFDRSWYCRVSEDRVNDVVKKGVWSRAYDEINCFERQLYDDGNVIIKFFLHISKVEQRKRLKRLQNENSSPWSYLPLHWYHHKQYDKYYEAYEEMFKRTNTPWAPWTLVPSHDAGLATLTVMRTVKEALERRRWEVLDPLFHKTPSVPENGVRKEKVSPILSKVDLKKDMNGNNYENQLEKLQMRLRELNAEVFRDKVPVVIVYSGWDAAGKGGNIKRLVEKLDPRGYKVIPIIVPTQEEKDHHYLWRFWRELPQAGRIAVFDRSWYGRVMVERIEGFCTEEEWRRAYREINEMEEEWTNNGTVLVKFFLHIDKETQKERFNERMNNPYKNWKITEEDFRNRAKWDQYYEAIEEMLYRTNTKSAPWTVLESNSKQYSRIKALRTVIEAIEGRKR